MTILIKLTQLTLLITAIHYTQCHGGTHAIIIGPVAVHDDHIVYNIVGQTQINSTTSVGFPDIKALQWLAYVWRDSKAQLCLALLEYQKKISQHPITALQELQATSQCAVLVENAIPDVASEYMPTIECGIPLAMQLHPENTTLIMDQAERLYANMLNRTN